MPTTSLSALVITAIAAVIIALFVPGPLQGWQSALKVVGPDYSYKPFDADYAHEDFTQGLQRKYMGIRGPESLIFGGNSTDIYAGTGDGWLVRLLPTGEVAKIVHLGGRPIGGAFDVNTDGIYICVPPIGLVHVTLLDRRVQIVSSISDDEVPIRFPDDVRVASNGQVYFTDASVIAPWLSGDEYDVMAASKLDVAMGSGTGRLLRYDPRSGETHTLLSELHFANGIELSEDESFILVCETFAYRVTRYYLSGPKKGTSNVFAAALPGLPDGISRASNGRYWVALPSPVTPSLQLVQRLPLIGYMIAHMNPKRWPDSQPFAAVVQIDTNGLVSRVIADTKGLASHSLTSVYEKDGALWFGSLRNNFVGYRKI